MDPLPDKIIIHMPEKYNIIFRLAGDERVYVYANIRDDGSIYIECKNGDKVCYGNIPFECQWFK